MDAMDLIRRAEQEQAAQGIGRSTRHIPRLFTGQMAMELFHAELLRLPDAIQDHILDDDLSGLIDPATGNEKF